MFKPVSHRNYLSYAIFNICNVICNAGPLAVFKNTYDCQKIRCQNTYEGVSLSLKLEVVRIFFLFYLDDIPNYTSKFFQINLSFSSGKSSG